MSRRAPNPAAERAAQNQVTLKNLVKLEANKVCADCKRNKHPRWASWNLGVFVCIRCSGIHRGMGTHISRVKSVDLDSWTDEQLQSILSWGNGRANKYWEAKLAAGHVPSEAKIENFIRTKYELKRWVMDGPMPDPSTLDVEGDDNVPLSIVKEKQTIDRKESIRKASVGKSGAPQVDLMEGDPVPQRSSTAGPTASKPPPPKAQPAPPKVTSTKDSLLGLDFLGTEAAAPPRPASATSAPGVTGQSRPDLKQSILSLYATGPKQQAQPQSSQTHAGLYAGMPSPTMPQTQQAAGGLNDAFSGLSFGAAPSAKSLQASSAFSNLGNLSSNKSTPSAASPAFSNLSGGSFFDAKPTQTPPSHQQKASFGTSAGFGAFATPTLSAPAPQPAPAPAASSSSAMGDLFDFSMPAQPAAPAAGHVPSTGAVNSVFNLSATQPKTSPPAGAPAVPPLASSSTNWSNSDVWGGNAWSTPAASTAAPAKSPEAPKASTLGSTTDFGWGGSGSGLSSTSIVPGASGGFSPTPKVAADEEFGGWTSSTTATGGTAATKASGGVGGGEDLFSNVWQ